MLAFQPSARFYGVGSLRRTGWDLRFKRLSRSRQRVVVWSELRSESGCCVGTLVVISGPLRQKWRSREMAALSLGEFRSRIESCNRAKSSPARERCLVPVMRRDGSQPDIAEVGKRQMASAAPWNVRGNLPAAWRPSARKARMGLNPCLDRKSRKPGRICHVWKFRSARASPPNDHPGHRCRNWDYRWGLSILSQ